MRRVLSICFLVFSTQAFSAANDFVVNQRDSTDSSTQPRLTTIPSTNGFLTYDVSTQRPAFTSVGTGLSISSGVLSATGSAVNADWNSSSGLSQILNKPIIPAAQVNSDWNSVSGLSQILNKPSLATVATSGSYNDLSNKPTIPTVPTRSFSYTTRALNTCFQPSSTRDAIVNYAVDIATSLSLSAGQQGTVFLEIFTDSGCTTGTQELARFVNGQTGTLTIGLALTQNVTGSLSGVIPAGAYVKLRTQNNTGTPTFTARPGQETLL